MEELPFPWIATKCHDINELAQKAELLFNEFSRKTAMPEPDVLDNIKENAKFAVDWQLNALALAETPLGAYLNNLANDPDYLRFEEAKKQALEKRFPEIKDQEIEARPKHEAGLLYCLQAGEILKLGITDNFKIRKEVLIVALQWITQAEQIQKQIMEPFAITGEKVKQGAQGGHKASHGTIEEKKSRWMEYQEHINELFSKNSHLSYSDLQKSAAKHFNVSIKTIQRHTTSPKKSNQS